MINVSSLASFYPMPLKAVYAASKRFLLDFTRATRQELRKNGVRLLALCPAGLATKPETINSINSQGLMGELTTMQIGDVAAKTISRALWGCSVYIPGWMNQILKYFGTLVPADWIACLIGRRWSKTRQIAAHILRFPNIIRAHIIGPLLYTKRKDELSYLLNSWVDLASQAIKPYISIEKSKQLKFNLNMVFSVILISGLLAGPPEDYGWIDLNDTDERRALMDYAIQQILG